MDKPILRRQFILSEIRSEQHAMACMRGDFEAVDSEPITAAERIEAETVIADEAAAARELLAMEYTA